MKNLYTMLAVAVVVGSGLFYGGMKYAQSRGTASFRNLSPEERRAAFSEQGGMLRNRDGAGTRTGMGNVTGGGVVNGEIISRDDQSITVKLRDGGSKIILFSDATHISKPVDGSGEDLAQGRQVVAIGMANPDGSITAESIQVRIAANPLVSSMPALSPLP